MSRRFSPTLIGAFVVGAVVLVVVGVATLGSGRFFRTVHPYVLFFSGNVNGLKSGAPVKFKGVEIGSVKSVLLNASAIAVLDGPVGDVRIPVIVELDERNMAQKGGKVIPNKQTIRLLVDNGLRAQLAMESIVTGLLYVKLDLQPGTPLRLVNDPTVDYPEIPTLPTPLEEVQMRASQFLAQLENTDFAGLLASLGGALDGANELFNSPDLKNAVGSLDEAVKNIETLIASLNETVISFQSLASAADTRVQTLSERLDQTLADAEQTSRAARKTLQSIQGFVAPDSPIVYQLGQTLEDVSASARGIRRFTEDLERNPSLLVRGKATPEEPR